MIRRVALTIALGAFITGCGLVLGLAPLGYDDPADKRLDPNGSLADGGSTFDGPASSVPSQCGDGRRTGVEACEGSDLDNASCPRSVGLGWSGTVACSPQCTLATAGCTPPAVTTYFGLAEIKDWSSFDLTKLTTEHPNGFKSAVFDGTYVYLVPSTSGVALRHDTKADLGDKPAGWAVVDLERGSSPAATGFFGGAFDGRYVYLVPYARSGTPHGVVARYDPQLSFSASSAWETFDLQSIHPEAIGFTGAVFDGRYLYFVPNGVSAPRGVVARLDTRNTFGAKDAWSVFDLAAVSPNARPFAGGAFDGRYVYLTPGTGSSTAVRYDTQAPLTDATAWAAFDVSVVAPGGRGYLGAKFDGRYVYLVPSVGPAGTAQSEVVRFDTTASFTAGTSWSRFDTTTLGLNVKGFSGAVFDGRNIYLSPSASGAPNGSIAVFDTTGEFTTAPAWTATDLAFVGAGLPPSSTPIGPLNGFGNGVFDGRSIYYPPGTGTRLLRVQVKGPAWVPRGWNASFL